MSLPPGYVGYDIERFFKDHAQPAKTEFETAEQYRARVAGSIPSGTYACQLRSIRAFQS